MLLQQKSEKPPPPPPPSSVFCLQSSIVLVEKNMNFLTVFLPVKVDVYFISSKSTSDVLHDD